MNWFLFIVFTVQAEPPQIGNAGNPAAIVQDMDYCVPIGTALVAHLNMSDFALARGTVFSFRCVERPAT